MRELTDLNSTRFNAARGFVGGAATFFGKKGRGLMGFNAARGFVGGAAESPICCLLCQACFNAARGFVGGAAGNGHA